MQDTTNHDLAIDYLRSGTYFEERVDKYDLLAACVYDYDQILSDYLN